MPNASPVRPGGACSAPWLYIYIYILEAKGRYAPHPATRCLHLAIVSCDEAKARDAPRIVEPRLEF